MLSTNTLGSILFHRFGEVVAKLILGLSKAVL